MRRKKCCPAVLRFRNVWGKQLKVSAGQKIKGSLTVEAAIVVPVVLLCILLLVEAGIQMYAGTTELVQQQEIWKDFRPAEKFRKLELLEEVFGAVDIVGGKKAGGNV